jgi:ABC-type sugar transport system ATPase subunit
MSDRSSVLTLRGITKRFGGVHALRGADLSANEGEIMALCGENGAGKSTLMKVLGGVYPFGSYGGDVVVFGHEQRLRSPSDAHDAGIGLVHQELLLVPELSVAHNLLLGREPRRFGVLDDERLEQAARGLLDQFGLGGLMHAGQRVAELGIGLMQMVEILRALSRNTRVLVLDEPTAALTHDESERLFGWLRALKADGATVIYVSHRLNEVFELCDRVTVLRDGRTAATLATSETTPEAIANLMVGRALSVGARSRKAGPSRPVLETRELSVRGPSARDAVSGISCTVGSGEIVALAGAMGSGRTALLSTLFGCARTATAGQILLDGVPVRFDSPRAAIRAGIALVPEDRKGGGLVLDMTVAENLTLPWLASPEVLGTRARAGLTDEPLETVLANQRIASLRIRGAATSPASTLSGGNQQKVALGKWLERPPKLLLLDEPTRGVDVGAREEIYGLLEELAGRGVAILFASSDLTEVTRLADRIFVLRNGMIVGEIDGALATQAMIVQLVTGARGDA